MDERIKALTDLLRGVAQEVSTLEGEAQALLHDRNDPQGYRGKMVEKATLLAELADQAARPLAALPPAQAKPLRERIERFSRSAATALDIGSVFFMSALLYPEDYKPGEPNDLETFLETIGAQSQDGPGSDQ
jgi:hypothetical protein